MGKLFSDIYIYPVFSKLIGVETHKVTFNFSKSFIRNWSEEENEQ